MKITFAERMHRHQQRRACLAQSEARLRRDERKHHHRRLIEIGMVVEKAGLLDLDLAVLCGALRSVRDDAADPRKVQGWAEAGARALTLEVQGAFMPAATATGISPGLPKTTPAVVS